MSAKEKSGNMQSSGRITQRKAEEKQRNDTERRKCKGKVRRCQRLTAHYRENQEKRGEMHHSFALFVP